MTALVALLCLPELALLGFFTTGALLSAPSGEARHGDAVVVLGGDGGMGGRYARGRDLVLAGYSQRLILLYPSAAQIADAQARVPGVEIVESMPAPGSSGSWGEVMTVRQRMQAEGLRTVMVVSDPPHMLRLRYTWELIGVRLQLISVRISCAMRLCCWGITWCGTGLGGEGLPAPHGNPDFAVLNLRRCLHNAQCVYA